MPAVPNSTAGNVVAAAGAPSQPLASMTGSSNGAAAVKGLPPCPMPGSVAPIVAASLPAPMAPSIAGPPLVATAPITAPIVGFPSAPGKPAFVPLDDQAGEQNALQLFVQKMKIQDDKSLKEQTHETDVKPLPLRIDGGFGG